ncbi:MAG: hypothetical protein R3C25_05525 [Hyphomonadaceae bacterium]
MFVAGDGCAIMSRDYSGESVQQLIVQMPARTVSSEDIVAFQSDYKMKRTWDPDSGWELFDETTGPGYSRFILRHATQAPIQFWGETLSIENTGGRTSNGHLECRQVFKVHAVNGCVGAAAVERERDLIEGALGAYGSANNGPLGPVEVIFSD